MEKLCPRNIEHHAEGFGTSQQPSIISTQPFYDVNKMLWTTETYLW